MESFRSANSCKIIVPANLRLEKDLKALGTVKVETTNEKVDKADMLTAEEEDELAELMADD
jgi:hypothetical protein